MEWPEYKLVIEPHKHRQFGAGVIVRQGPEDTDCYFARDWRLPEHEELLSQIVDACLKRGLILVLFENAPQSDRRGINGDGVRYIGFGQINVRGRAPAWDCTFDSRVYGDLKEFFVHRRYEPALLAAFGDAYKSVVRLETGGGQHLLVKLSCLEIALDAVVGRFARITGAKPMNTILYGPPGTGKTYNTAERAVKICDPGFSGDRAATMIRYRELSEKGQIAFVTFHQSFAYEEFVEGLRPEAAQGGVQYRVRSGTLRKIAFAAMGGDIKADSPKGNNNGFENLYRLLLEEVRKSDPKKGLEMTTKRRNPFRLQLNGTVLTAHIIKATAHIYQDHLSTKWANEGSIINPGDCDKFGGRGNSPYYFSVIERLRALKKSSPEKIDDLEKEPSPADDEEPTEQNYVLIIDEINRANISKVFGELITLLEPDKRLGAENELTVTLPCSGEKFGLPPNLYIIGTMNTADRSIALLDIALRRRFNFVEMEPQAKHELIGINVDGVNLQKLLETLNLRIEFLLDRDHRIGHAYFMGIDSLEALNEVFQNRIIPLLQEYFYDDWRRIVQVLATGESAGDAVSGFIKEKIDVPKIPGVDPDRLGKRYQVNRNAFAAANYRAIYEGANRGNPAQ